MRVSTRRSRLPVSASLWRYTGDMYVGSYPRSSKNNSWPSVFLVWLCRYIFKRESRSKYTKVIEIIQRTSCSWRTFSHIVSWLLSAIYPSRYFFLLHCKRQKTGSCVWPWSLLGRLLSTRCSIIKDTGDNDDELRVPMNLTLLLMQYGNIRAEKTSGYSAHCKKWV